MGKILPPLAGESSHNPASAGPGTWDGFLDCAICEILTAGIYFLKNIRILYVLVSPPFGAYLYSRI